MIPVHVIVGSERRAEAMWQQAFGNAINLYSFDRNIDTFERLAVAEAPIDLVILTPAQSGPFNLTPDQFVSRIFDTPLAHSRMLSNLHIIVVGSELKRSHPRVMSVRTLDAAIRLVKFGELEEPANPTHNDYERVSISSVTDSRAPLPQAAPSNHASQELNFGQDISSSIISQIWASADANTDRPSNTELNTTNTVSGGGQVSTSNAADSPSVSERKNGLFLHEKSEISRDFELSSQQTRGGCEVTGGGYAPTSAEPVPATELQPALPYKLPNGAGYRGPALRNGEVYPAGYAHMQQSIAVPIPPALTAQINQSIYPAAPKADPVLSFSGNGISNDPFLRRAEQTSGEVSFG